MYLIEFLFDVLSVAVCHQGQICKKADTCLNLYPCVIKYYFILSYLAESRNGQMLTGQMPLLRQNNYKLYNTHHYKLSVSSGHLLIDVACVHAHTHTHTHTYSVSVTLQSLSQSP